jgi:hypothetical protein
LSPKEIFQQLAAVLWAVVYESVMKTISYDGFHSRLGCDWTEIMCNYHVYHEHWPRMPITMLHNTSWNYCANSSSHNITSKYSGFCNLHYAIHRPASLTERIGNALRIGHAGYRIV